MSYKNNTLYIHLLHSDSCTTKVTHGGDSEPIYSVGVVQGRPQSTGFSSYSSKKVQTPLHNFICAKYTQDMSTVTSTNTQAPGPSFGLGGQHRFREFVSKSM